MENKIMDYEKAYKEAFERAKNYHDNNFSFGTTQLTEAIFPELKEPEDERIRKALAQLIITDIEELIKSADSRTYFSGVKEYLEDIRQFAYNKGIVDAEEKQKEQQPAEWSDEDEEMISSIEQWLHEEKPEYVEKELAWLKSLRPQPHWKPSEEQVSILGKVFAGCQLKDSERDSMVDLFYHLKDMI